MFKKYLIPTLAVLVILFISYAVISWITREIESRELTLNGNVDIRYVDLSFRVPGRLTEMRFEEGDTVKKGDVLAVLDNIPYKNRLALAQANYDQSNANYEKITSGNRPQEIEQAQANVEQMQASFDDANALFKRNQQLLSTGAIAKQTYDDSLARKNQAEAALKAAQEALNLSQSGFRKEDIDAAQAQLLASQVQVSIAQVGLEDTAIIAPNDGYIYTRILEPGSIVGIGTPVYTLSLLSPVWVRAYVAEPNLGKIKPGMKVQVYSDSFNKPLPGQIGYISPQAEFTPKNIETPELRTDLVYRLRVTVDDPTGKLRQGMPVTVKIKLAD